MRTRRLAKLTPDAITALVAAGATMTSPYSVLLLDYLHGAATRIADHDSAFGLRRDHFLVEILAGWEPGPTKNGTSSCLWVKNLSNVLAQEAFAGGHPNLFGPDDHEQTASAQAAYAQTASDYGRNLAALQKAKRRYDPCAVFSETGHQ